MNIPTPRHNWSKYVFPTYTKEGEDVGNLLETYSGDNVDDKVYEVHVRMGGLNRGAPFVYVEQFRQWLRGQKRLNDIMISHSVKEVKRASHPGICSSTFIFMFVVCIYGKDIDVLINYLRDVKGLTVNEVKSGVLENVPAACAVKRRRRG